MGSLPVHDLPPTSSRTDTRSSVAADAGAREPEPFFSESAFAGVCLSDCFLDGPLGGCFLGGIEG